MRVMGKKIASPLFFSPSVSILSCLVFLPCRVGGAFTSDSGVKEGQGGERKGAGGRRMKKREKARLGSSLYS